jgi:hypothetical protein
MVAQRLQGGVAMSVATLSTGFHLGWKRLAATRARRHRGEFERSLASCADRFELERRERALMRWQSSDGSLLG